MILLVDIGNTLIKFALSNGKKEDIKMIGSLETKSLDWKNQVIKIFKQITNKDIQSSIMSSVVPKREKSIYELIKKYFKVATTLVNSSLLKLLPLKFNLNNQQIGSDFLALAIGTNSYYGNSIVVSLGTATTYSIIKDDELIGVIIGPGFTGSKCALINDAALIASFNLQTNPSVLGATTNHALSIGFGNGFNYMINSTINAINTQLKMKLQVIVTGNAHSELQPFLTFDYKYNRELLMIGLIIIYQSLNKNNKIKT